MNLWDETRTVMQLARWGLTLVRHDTHYPSPVPDNPKFMSPCDAVRLIRDGDVVAESGLAAQQHASIIYWAIREAFEETGHPAGPHGHEPRRPRRPGHRAGHPGGARTAWLVYAPDHRPLRDLPGDARPRRRGKMRAAMSPARRHGAALRCPGARPDLAASRPTGVGTFLDPRVGSGTRGRGVHARSSWSPWKAITCATAFPKIDVAVFNVPAADRHGNLYVTHCATIGESREIARAAKRNHGRVIANVGCLVDEDPRPHLPAGRHGRCGRLLPGHRQTVGVFHRNYWPAITTESDVPIAEGFARMQFVNWLAGVTPRRTAADEAVARLAAATLLGQHSPRRLRQHRRRLPRGGVPGHLRDRAAGRSDLPRRERRRRRPAGAGHLLRCGVVPGAHRLLGGDVQAVQRAARCHLSRRAAGRQPRQRQRLQARAGAARLRRAGRLHRPHRSRQDHRVRLGVDGARRVRRRRREAPPRQGRHTEVRRSRRRDHLQRTARGRTPGSTSSTPPTSDSSS